MKNSATCFGVLVLSVLIGGQGKPSEKTQGKPPGRAKEVVTNSIGMKMVLIPAGEFMMGSNESPQETAKAFEAYGKPPASFFKFDHPQHRVRITKPFYLGAHEVTVGQFRQFVNDARYKTDAENDGKGGFGFDTSTDKFARKPEYTWRSPGFAQTADHPVVNVSHNDAVAFSRWLGRKEGKRYRLPTEAEWEYACRAGTQTRYYNGDDPERLAQVGNVADAAAKTKFPWWTWTIPARDGYVFTAPVGSFKANGFGLYDMHGNVWEWCADWFDYDYYGQSPPEDPVGPDSGTSRVLRGGSWVGWPYEYRSADRGGGMPVSRTCFVGFRAARTE